MPASSSLVSVLIPTRNSATHLAACVATLRAQTYRELEILVIDNGSTDGTPALAATLADRVLEYGPERCAQLNEGARRARGAYLYRVDADFIVDPTVVSTAVAACEAGADAVCVPNESSADISFIGRVRRFERLMYKHDPLIVGARFFTRRAFEAVGGFDEQLVAGEDYDIHNRMLARGFRLAVIEPVEVHLGEPTSLVDFVTKSYYYGTTFSRFLAKNGARGIAQVNPVRAAFFRNWRSFVRHPGLGLAFCGLQLLKYGAGACGMVAALVRGPAR